MQAAELLTELSAGRSGQIHTGILRVQEPFLKQAGTQGRWTSCENQPTTIGAAFCAGAGAVSS
jgi:hypothetical protein